MVKEIFSKNLFKLGGIYLHKNLIVLPVIATNVFGMTEYVLANKDFTSFRFINGSTIEFNKIPEVKVEEILPLLGDNSVAVTVGNIGTIFTHSCVDFDKWAKYLTYNRFLSDINKMQEFKEVFLHYFKEVLAAKDSKYFEEESLSKFLLDIRGILADRDSAELTGFLKYKEQLVHVYKILLPGFKNFYLLKRRGSYYIKHSKEILRCKNKVNITVLRKQAETLREGEALIVNDSVSNVHKDFMKAFTRVNIESDYKWLSKILIPEDYRKKLF